MTKNELEERLVVGAKIRIGKEYANESSFKEGDIIELIEGQFEYDNGLYIEIIRCPSIWNEDMKEYDSIYHLFENDLSLFMDCEIIKQL